MEQLFCVFKKLRDNIYNIVQSTLIEANTGSERGKERIQRILCGRLDARVSSQNQHNSGAFPTEKASMYRSFQKQFSMARSKMYKKVKVTSEIGEKSRVQGKGCCIED